MNLPLFRLQNPSGRLRTVALFGIMILAISATAFGGGYWQNVVHYSIDARLDPATARVSGSERLVYTNNSPDALDKAYFRLYWNAFTDNSRGQQFQRDNKNYGWNNTGGMTVTKFAIVENGTERMPVTRVDNTVMEVELQPALAPGDSMVFSIDFNGRIIDGGNRTGHQGRDFDVAQWYPQISVYDRYGWDRNQYLTPAEFHDEFGTFDVKITLPRSFLLGYCGSIVNPEEVYPDSVREHLKAAYACDTTVHIMDNARAKYTDADTALKTWKFHAENVRDFAWSANEHYIWDAECWHPGGGNPPILIHALYFEDKRPYWEKTAHYGEHAISFFSTHYGMFAYPNMFVIEGTEGGGMEYPGLTFLGHFGDPDGHTLHDVATHEIGHNWFPMMLDNNETNYAFMDEGFNSFITMMAVEDFFGRYHQQEWASPVPRFFHYDRDDERAGTQRGSIELAKTGYEEPIATHVYRFNEQGIYGSSIYGKTASVLLMLQYVMGDSIFGHAMLEYYNRYKFKHVYPEDFYQTMQDASGRKDLRWFFDEWFNRTERCDYAVSHFGYSELTSGSATTYRTHITAERRDQAIMPVDVRFTMEDGTTKTIWFPIEQWLNGEWRNDTTVDLPSRPVKAELNPDGRILDVNRLNNSTGMPPVKFGFDNTMWAVTPVDSYMVRWRPSLWYTDEGGFQPGVRFTGSYLDDFYKTNLGAWYNIRERKPDFDLSMSHNTVFLTPLSSVSGRVYHIEGRTGGEVVLSKGVREHYSFPPNHTFSMRYNYLVANNNDYLLQPLQWNDGTLQRITAWYDYFNRGQYWSVTAQLSFEASAAILGQSDFSYSKRTLDLRTNLTMIPGMSLAFRFIDGFGTGMLPNQVKYYASDAAPADLMGQPFFRSKGMLPSTVRDHAISGGGGYLRGYMGAFAADKIEALNAEARFPTYIPFVNTHLPVIDWLTRRLRSVIFFDAGRLATVNNNLWDERFEADAGIGLRMGSLNQFLGPVSGTNLLRTVGLTTIRVDFPIYVTMPPPGEEKLKFRWVVGIADYF